MENQNIVLRRPRKKLCYPTKNKSVPVYSNRTVTLDDVDRMFDDIHPPTPVDSLLTTFTPHKDFDAEIQDSGGTSPVLEITPAPKVSVEDLFILETEPSTHKLCADFTVHKPIQTSSPKEKEAVQQEDNACNIEERLTLNLQKDLLNNHSELPSAPSKLALGKPKGKVKNLVDKSCSKTNRTVEEKTQVPVVVGKDKTIREQNTTEHVSPVTQESEVDSPEEQSKSVYNSSLASASTRDTRVFLQKLKVARELKPATTHIKVPPPPPPISDQEDDFLILEDEVPYYFTIPGSATIYDRQKLNKVSSTEKVNSPKKGTKARPQLTSHKEKMPVKQQMRRKNVREKKTEVTGPETVEEEFSSHVDAPAGDTGGNEEPIKKKKNKRFSSNVSDKPEEQHKDTASRETKSKTISHRGKNKMLSKGSKFSSKEFEASVKKRRVKSSKGAGRTRPGSGGELETESGEVVEEQAIDEYLDVDMLPVADDEVMDSVQQVKVSTANMDRLNNSPVGPEESPTLYKRKRTRNGPVCLSYSDDNTEEFQATGNPRTLKKSKLQSKESDATEPSPVPVEDIKSKKINQKQTELFPSHRMVDRKGKKTKKKTAKNNKKKQKKDEDKQQQEFLDRDPDSVESSPLVFTHSNNSFVSGDHIFPRVYPPEKPSFRAAPVSPKRHPVELITADLGKRRRKPPGMWWTVNSESEELETVSSQQQQTMDKKPRPVKERTKKQEKKNKKKPSRPPGPQTPPKISTPVRLQSPEGAHVSLLKQKTKSASRTIKRTMAKFKDIFTSMPETSGISSRREAEQNDGSSVTVTGNHTQMEKEFLSTDATEIKSTLVSPIQLEDPQDSRCQPGDVSKGIRSGPSSLIVLQSFEKNDDTGVASAGERAVLCVSDICAPPLKPIVLQPKDRATLTNWFKNLWSSTVHDGVEITADDFDWFFYQGSAMGLQVDLNSGSICNGKILLGSYTKKPLWVDHSATTVFNLLTSSVTVTIDGSKSQVSAGQSFMVQCGRAYSLQNNSTQPAILYFTRILAESPD